MTSIRHLLHLPPTCAAAVHGSIARFASSQAGGAAVQPGAEGAGVAGAEGGGVVKRRADANAAQLPPFNPMDPDVYRTLSTWTVLRSAAIFTACSQQWLVGPMVSMLRAAHGTPAGYELEKETVLLSL